MEFIEAKKKQHDDLTRREDYINYQKENEKKKHVKFNRYGDRKKRLKGKYVELFEGKKRTLIIQREEKTRITETRGERHVEFNKENHKIR